MLNTRVLDNEEAFFAVLFNDDLWRELKKHMFPNQRSSNFYNYKDGDAAARHGYLTLLKEKNNLNFTILAMGKAAKYDHHEIVKWLYFNNSIFSCPVHAMNKAAEYGHLDIIMFLDNHGVYNCTTHLMDQAIIHGHLEIVKFLYNFRDEGYTKIAYQQAVMNGHRNVIDFLNSRKSKQRTKKVYEDLPYEPCKCIETENTTQDSGWINTIWTFFQSYCN